MKNITAKLLALGLSAAMITCGITACKGGEKTTGNSETTQETQQSEESEQNEQSVEADPEENVPGIGTGAWAAAESNAMTDDLNKIFEKAVSELDGYYYRPVALIGTQIVAGTNYCFLCTNTIQGNSATNAMKLTYIYVDLSGEAKFVKDEVLKLPGTDDSGEKVGGWAYAESTEITDAIKKVMEKATETLTGATYEPVAYIGSQVVAGTNHAILCKCSPSVADLNGATTYILVYVYEDLQGNCEITDTTDVVLSID